MYRVKILLLVVFGFCLIDNVLGQSSDSICKIHDKEDSLYFFISSNPKVNCDTLEYVTYFKKIIILFDKKIHKITFFLKKDGTFLFRNFHTKYPYSGKAELHYCPDKNSSGMIVHNQKVIEGGKIFVEKYVDETGLRIDTLKNYFPDLLLKDSVLYNKSIEYSYILQNMHEPIFSDITDSLVLRMVTPVNFFGALGVEYFNSIRIHFYKDSTKVFKTKSKLNKAEYKPIANSICLVSKNKVHRLKKDLSMFSFNYPPLLYNPNSYYPYSNSYPMLLEYKNGSEYHMYLVRDYYGNELDMRFRDALLFKEIIMKIRKLMKRKNCN